MLRLLASALALILTFGSTGVYAATTTGYKNDDVKLTATRDEESNKIAVTLYADREMYEPFFSFIYSAAAETNNATFDSYTANMNIFNSNNSNPQRMVHLMNGGHSPQKDDELFSIIYKIDGEFEADKDYTFLVQFDEAFDGNFEYYKWSADAMEVTYRENTVSFDLNGGDSAAIPDQIVVSGDKATKPENPTREGYTFKYWTKDGAEFDFSTPITEKTQLVAEWEEDAKTYTLDYNMNGGTNGPEDETKESKDNSVDFTVSNVKPEKNTYDFLGWADTNDATEATYQAGATITVTSNDANLTKTIYAVWKLKEYTVTWKNEDGTVLETDENVPYGSTPSYDGQTPAKAATEEKTYEFDGWTPEIADVTGDVTYTAKYKETTNTYTVTWKNEDGTVLETDENVPYGTTPTYDGETPAKATTAEKTYTFAGWTPEVKAVTGDVTYTATFTEQDIPKTNYTVTFDSDGGTSVAAQTVEEGQTATSTVIFK